MPTPLPQVGCMRPTANCFVQVHISVTKLAQHDLISDVRAAARQVLGAIQDIVPEEDALEHEEAQLQELLTAKKRAWAPVCGEGSLMVKF